MKNATLHVDLDAIIYNYRHLKCYYKKQVIVVLKDNAYGVGLKEVYKALENEEGLIIAVSKIDEILLLRENNFKGEIIYLNVFDKEDVTTLKDNKVTVIIDTLDQLKLVKEYNLKFHLKINTGMNRLGLKDDEIETAISLINKDESYLLTGVMTHFANEDKEHKSYLLFEKYVKKIKRKNLIIHCFASSSLNEYFDNISTHIRVGLKLYGISERTSFLSYALSLISPIISIKKINKNQLVGYDYIYETPILGYLIILPIGYGQGLYRFNKSVAYVDNIFIRQAGKISMDYSTYFSSKSIDKNSEIELFGKKVPIESLCAMNNIAPHEMLVNLKVNKQYHITKIKKDD